ncbi:MAG: fructosamine kinase family protein [Pseudomonadota bacterium]|nr:fructosamine kinase family protein [Pseudomonadota bacterium]
MTSTLIAEISNAIADASGEAFRVSRQFSASGGCINHSLILAGVDGRRFFVKLNQAAQLSMFEAEAAGLAELIGAQAIRVPEPLTRGLAAGQSFLVMEWLDLSQCGDSGNPGGNPGSKLGERLAMLHSKTWRAFGWWRDNTIGSTRQANSATNNWIDFYRDQRLAPQLDLAARHGAERALLDSGERLLAELDAFFPGYSPQPSLLHGDLWSGNTGYCEGEPVLFDPAVYYGDRETDIAMTELFGGFPDAFYAAYNAAWPLDQGYSSRKLLYQLYHLLNHFNLFGGAYAGQSQTAIKRLLAALR